MYGRAVNLDLLRVVLTPESTLGVLSVDGVMQCWVLEDTVREGPKVAGRTAIPPGRYPVLITHSPRFGVEMPLVGNVPGFTGIRIHPGNTTEDTDGCLLPGTRVAFDPSNPARVEIADSRAAYVALFNKLKAAVGPISLVVRSAPR